MVWSRPGDPDLFLGGGGRQASDLADGVKDGIVAGVWEANHGLAVAGIIGNDVIRFAVVSKDIDVDLGTDLDFESLLQMILDGGTGLIQRQTGDADGAIYPQPDRAVG